MWGVGRAFLLGEAPVRRGEENLSKKISSTEIWNPKFINISSNTFWRKPDLAGKIQRLSAADSLQFVLKEMGKIRRDLFILKIRAGVGTQIPFSNLTLWTVNSNE